MLSIVITVVGGKECVRRCLHALCPQVQPGNGEIVVPYDRWSREIADLTTDFPQVRFHCIQDPGIASSTNLVTHAHGLYDRRRAVGISLAKGHLIALTEDRFVPADDWCQQILRVHDQPHAAIGGAVENAVDRPLHWALYYCDFGRYGRPRSRGQAEYVSDVNVAYKHRALESIQHVWRDTYQETTVHWALQARGEVVFFDPRFVVYQHRPAVTFREACRERIEFGRGFAETRVATSTRWQRIGYAAGTPLLPALLLGRVVRHMMRQRRTIGQLVATLPLAACLLAASSLGECVGYVAGPPRSTTPPEVTAHTGPDHS